MNRTRSAIPKFLVSCVGLAWFLGGAQTVPPPSPSFEVVSIRPSDPNNIGWHYKEFGDGITITGATVKSLLADAYGIKAQYIFGGSAWIDSATYDINARFDESVVAKLATLTPAAKREQLFVMLRPVLEERFKLIVRRESREMPTYALVLAKGVPKFSPSPPDSNTVSSDAKAPVTWNGHLWTVNQEPMSFWAVQLSNLPDIGREVIDQTGLKGNYNFTFDWSAKTDPDVSIFTALQEQLGLKLEPTKGPIETLVIDHIERPSEN